MNVPLAPNRNLALAGALLEELARAGVRHVCVCPGSRSTPLAAAAAELARERGDVRIFAHVDERSAGFFALGLAKWSRRPAVLICTSGTAAANFLPAVVEASHAKVPLIVLTADRPGELRDWGAPQTIDQLRLFGPFVRLFAEVPPPEANAPRLRHARALAARAVAVALGRPAGPVHLNLPFREPLEPLHVAGDVPHDLAERDALAALGRPERAYTRVHAADSAPEPELVSRLAAEIAATPCGVILAGPLDASPETGRAAARLARAAGWPLLAEPTSQLRCGAHVADAPLATTYDAFLRGAAFAAAHAPARALRLGAPLTSKPVAQWLERDPATELWIVDPDGGFADPAHRAAEIFRFEPGRFCDALARELERLRPRAPESDWLAAFARAERRTREALELALEAESRLLGPRVVAELAPLLPDGAALFVSNSLSVRDLDLLLPASPRRLRVLSNRGASGIDGIASTALGAAAAGAAPLVLLTGDLAFLHDLGGLLAARRHALSATIVVVNNDGGGIFSLLPVAAYGDEVGFDALFTTPHGVDLEPAARLCGADFARVRTWEELRLALKQAIGAPGLHLVEVPVDRENDTAQRRALFAAVAEALA